jgi:Ca-activated chloride channel family protein
MTFDYPFVLAAFAIFIPLILFDIFSGTRKYGKLPARLGKKVKLSVLFFRVFIAFAIIALAGPRWGMGLTASQYRRGLDTVFAIDVSRSMDIRDAQTGAGISRLERGLLIASQSVAAVPSARFAAAIGRGRGFLAVPLTWDNEAILSFLESLNGFSMTGRSTNLESLVQAAADAFQNTSPARKVIVLVSDGESHSGVLANALNRCVRENIIVISIALGSDEGSPVPGGNLSADTDAQTPSAVSRRDSSVMRTAAEKTGGIYIDGSLNDTAFILSNHLLSLSYETGSASSQSEPKERRSLFVILAILAYAFSKFAPLISRLPAVSMVVFVLFFTSCSEGRLLLIEANYLNSRGRYDEAIVPYLKALNYEDSAPYAEYGLGLTFYLLDEGKAALKRFDSSQKKLDNFSAAEHRELRYRNSYNSGVVHFEEGDFHSAAAAFRDALRVDSRKIEAKRNLELSLLSIAHDESENKSAEGLKENETREILFEYLRDKEQRQWKSREWAPEERQTGPDY